MAYFTKPIVARGAVIDIPVGVSHPALQLLRNAGKAIPQPVRLEAVIDTGAAVTCIDCRAVTSLGLIRTGSLTVTMPAAIPPGQSDQFSVSIEILHPANPKLNLIVGAATITDAEVRNTGVDALIGCDLLRRWEFTYNGRAGMFTLDY